MEDDNDLLFLLGLALVAIGIATKIWALVGAGALLVILSNKKK